MAFFRYFRKVASRMGIEVSFVDATDPQNVAQAMRPNTKMVSNYVCECVQCVYLHYWVPWGRATNCCCGKFA